MSKVNINGILLLHQLSLTPMQLPLFNIIYLFNIDSIGIPTVSMKGRIGVNGNAESLIDDAKQ